METTAAHPFTLAPADLNQSDVTEHNVSLLARDENLAKVEIIVQAVILYLALFGNCVVLVVLRVRRQKLSRMQWFIVHLSIADIIVAVFNVLPQLIWDITVRFHGNDLLCRLVKYLQVVPMYGSSYVLVMTAIDRYVSICHPLVSQTLTPLRVHLMIAVAWGLSLLFALPQLFIFSQVELEPGVSNCWVRFPGDWAIQLYTTWSFLSVYAVPCVLLALCYGRICHVVWLSVGSKEAGRGTQLRSSRHEKWRISFRKTGGQTQTGGEEETLRGAPKDCVRGAPRGHVRSVSRSKKKTVKLTLVVVLCFVLCWGPFYVANMLSAFDPSVNMEHAVYVVVVLLASLNSCTNPWIYLGFSGKVCAKPERRISRSWTQSTHVHTHLDTESRTRSSMVDLPARVPTDACPAPHLHATSVF